MARVRSNNVFGTITNDPLAAGGFTLSSAGLVNLAAVASPDYAVITLDPNRVHGAPEIVYVTAHAGSATDGTVLRGREGTAAREHPLDTEWEHAPTALEFALGVLPGGYEETGASQLSITSEVDLTGLVVTVDIPADRMIRITGVCQAQSSGAADSLALRIKEGTTQLQLATTGDVGAANIQEQLVASVVLVGPSAGAHTYKLTLQVIGGGTARTTQGSNQPAYILVEDIGPDYTTQPT